MNICPNKLKPPNHSCSHLEIDFLKVSNPQLGSPDEDCVTADRLTVDDHFWSLFQAAKDSSCLQDCIVI